MKRLQAVVSDEFHRLIKLKATEEDKTIKDVMLEALKMWLKERGIEVE